MNSNWETTYAILGMRIDMADAIIRQEGLTVGLPAWVRAVAAGYTSYFAEMMSYNAVVVAVEQSAAARSLIRAVRVNAEIEAEKAEATP